MVIEAGYRKQLTEKQRSAFYNGRVRVYTELPKDYKTY